MCAMTSKDYNLIRHFGLFKTTCYPKFFREKTNAVTHVGSALRLEVSPKHPIGLKLPEMELQG